MKPGHAASGSETVGETTNASGTPGEPIWAGRPYNILELALHGVQAEVLDVLIDGPHHGPDEEHAPSALIQPSLVRSLQVTSGPVTVTFSTPTSARRCTLTVVGGSGRWSVARFSTVWPRGSRRLPSAADVNLWNDRALDGQHMMLRDDGSILLSLDADLDDITLQQIIPLWLRWDHCVEAARAFVMFGVQGA
jgi:hypothetical protein